MLFNRSLSLVLQFDARTLEITFQFPQTTPLEEGAYQPPFSPPQSHYSNQLPTSNSIDTPTLPIETALHVLYMDRDCCASYKGGSKFNSLFTGWPVSCSTKHLNGLIKGYSLPKVLTPHIVYMDRDY